MKKLKKYHDSTSNDNLEARIKHLKKLNASIIRSGQSILERPFVPLSAIIPIIASSINPLALSAQCGIATTSSGGGDLTLIDIDNDGTDDFILDPNADPNPDLFLGVLNGSEIMARPAFGAYFYATRFSTGANITSGNANWRDATELPVGGGGAGNQATLDYQSNGDWHGTGVVTGYVGIRIPGNRMGFLEVSWNNSGGSVTLNLANSGVQDASQAGTTTVPIGDCSVLPVTMIYFQARSIDNKAILQWATASEINNEGFEVQRSLDGKSFETVQWVEGQGNTSQEVKYEFTDNRLKSNATYYYRLKQMDYSGSFNYSEIISIDTKDVDQLYGKLKNANPVSDDRVVLEINSPNAGKTEILVFNVNGQQMSSKNYELDAGRNVVEMQNEDLAAGSYFISIRQEGEQFYIPIIIE